MIWDIINRWKPVTWWKFWKRKKKPNFTEAQLIELDAMIDSKAWDIINQWESGDSEQ